MQRTATAGNSAAGASHGQTTHHRAAAYQKVLDGRKRPIRGLWQRNGKFYARLSVKDPGTGRKQVRRVPLAGATSAARAELRRLLTKREDNALPVLSLTPKFSTCTAQYLAFYDVVKEAKRRKTVQTEPGHLNQWIKHLGDTRLDKINRALINAFIAKPQGQGLSGRTANLGVGVLRKVLRKTVDDGWIVRMPTDHLRPLKYTARKRPLFTIKEINAVCQAAVAESRNGVPFGDYLRLMAYCSRAVKLARCIHNTQGGFKLS